MRWARWLWLVPPACLALAIAASVVAAPHLPERMPIHWGVSGRRTNLLPSVLAIWFVPGAMLWVGALIGLIGWSMTSAKGGEDLPAWLSPGVTGLTTGFLLVIHLVVLAAGLGWGVSVPAVTTFGVGLLFVVLGWLMPRVPPNPLFGVRTARTLACPDTWRHANRAGGRWFVAAGVATLLAAPLPGAWPLAVMMGSITVACAASLAAVRDPASNETRGTDPPER